jgi:hypothetical protein
VKLGAENKKKVVAMVVLVVVALLIGVRAVSSFGVLGAPAPTPPAAAVNPAPTVAPVARATQKKGAGPQVPDNPLDPRLRTDLLEASRKLEYAGGKRNIFRMEEAPVFIPPPVAPVVVTNQPPAGPPPPPPPPPITLRFFGFASRPGEPKKVFLAEGSEVFVAKEGDIVDRRYKIVQINNNSVLVEDVLNNNRQSIQLTTASLGAS